jgi:AcrR family transcriptional regulator
MPYRPTAATEARKARTRELIVDAALAQVAEGGYASASVQAVARRARVATGTVYRHFPSKAELFAEVFRRASQREVDVVREIAGHGELPASERIAAGAEAFARRALANPTLAYALLAEPVDPAVEAERLAFRHVYRDVFAGALEEGIAAGELSPCDVETTAAALVGALGEALVGPLSPAGNGRARRSGREALVAGLVQFCLNAIQTKEESRVPDRAHA